MLSILRHLGVLVLLCVLSSCGGGDSTSTTLHCGTANCDLINDPVSTPFTQINNNLRVIVDDKGPQSFGIKTNMPFVTVTVCALGAVRTDTSNCATIDHVLVDTGSVGLRVFASQVKSLATPLDPVRLVDTSSNSLWECLPFVIGGLWGPNVGADVYMGNQLAAALNIQLIDDQNRLKPPSDCVSITDDSIMSTAGGLGANGVLGIGDTRLDCGLDCRDANYRVNSVDGTGSSTLYYDCPQAAVLPTQCSLATVPINYQVSNPVTNLPLGFNNGVLVIMPAIPDSQIGAATASGELIFGINSQPNNTIPNGTAKVYLGVANTASDSYLRVTTQFNGNKFFNSYLDTGSNGMFFTDKSITPCTTTSPDGYWYCPFNSMRNLTAVISDGDNPLLNKVTVPFQVDNFTVWAGTSNIAFNRSAGAINVLNPLYKADPINQPKYVSDTTTFAWGMPFFYGKKVYLSIWQQLGAEAGPWYAWTGL